MLLLLWLFQIVFLEQFYKAYKIKSLRDKAEIISEDINSAQLSDVIEDISESNDFSIRIIDEHGNNIASAQSKQNSEIMKMSASELIEHYYAEASNGVYYEIIDEKDIQPKEDFQDKPSAKPYNKPEPVIGFSENSFDEFGKKYERYNRGFGGPTGKTMVYAMTAKNSSGTNNLILLETELYPVSATTEALKQQLIYITLILLAIAVVLVLIISKRISKPIIKTNQTAKRLAKGEYPTDFDNKGYLEIAELNDTLKYASNELSKLEGLRNELISNVSHDLRTPLTMIGGYAEAMRDIPGESTEENLQIIIDETYRLKNLINELLDLSKIESGTQKLKISKFNITECTRDVLKRYSRLVANEGYILNFEYEKDAYIEADRTLIEQVLYNLINNAINYSGEDKTVIIRQTISPSGVKMEVIDHGSGIPKDMIPYVWKRYYNRPNNNSINKSTGLGLSIVKGALDLHNASYGVNSELGKGSNFWFNLPIKII